MRDEPKDSLSTIRYAALHAALQPFAGSPLRLRRKLGATYRDGGYLSSAARKVIDLLRDVRSAKAARRTGRQ